MKDRISKEVGALLVIVGTPVLRDWLRAHDPKAYVAVCWALMPHAFACSTVKFNAFNELFKMRQFLSSQERAFLADNLKSEIDEYERGAKGRELRHDEQIAIREAEAMLHELERGQ